MLRNTPVDILTIDICKQIVIAIQIAIDQAAAKNQIIDEIDVKAAFDLLTPADQVFSHNDLLNIDRYLSGLETRFDGGPGNSIKTIQLSTALLSNELSSYATTLYATCRNPALYAQAVSILLLKTQELDRFEARQAMQPQTLAFITELSKQIVRITQTDYGDETLKSAKLIALLELRVAILKNPACTPDEFGVLMNRFNNRTNGFRNEDGEELSSLAVLRVPRKSSSLFFCSAPIPKSWKLVSGELEKFAPTSSPKNS